MTIPAPRPAPRAAPGAGTHPALAHALADPARIREIARIDLDDPVLRSRLDAVARDTRARLGAAISLVTIVLDSVQLIAGGDGDDGWPAAVDGTPVEWSFCANAVLDGRPYVVDDTASDPRQAANPLVTRDGIASYCGVPVTTATGQVLGAHCVMGRQPHDYTAHEVAVLESAGQEIGRLLHEHTTAAYLGG